MKALVKNAWQPGRGYVESFATMMTALLGRYGLIFLDPLDPALKQLAAPLYSEAACRAPESATALEQRSAELERAGYHAQVLATANSFPLFLHDEEGRRTDPAPTPDPPAPRVRRDAGDTRRRGPGLTRARMQKNIARCVCKSRRR